MSDLAVNEMRSRILSYIRAYMDQNGYAPSYRDIQRALGVKSLATVYDHLRRLKSEGCLDTKTGQPRSITINRRLVLHDNSAHRVRVEMADGGVLFMDCTLKSANPGGIGFALSGIMDATQLKAPVSSIVNCSFENS